MSKSLVIPARRVGLERTVVFQGLSPQDLGHIEPLARLIEIGANDSLLTAGEVGDFVYFVLAGTICIHRVRSNGSRIILNMVGAGEMLGEVCALDNQGHSASALATEPTALLKMRRGDFCAAEESISLLSRNVKFLLVRRLRFATTLNEALAAYKVRCRVARLLLALAERYSHDRAQDCVPIPLRLTQNDIADWVCVSRQHAEKHLAHLQAEGVVQIAPGRRLVILNRHSLLHFCD